MTHRDGNQDVVRITLAVLFIGILISACFSILRPFLGALVWATMIVVTTWSVMLRLQQRLWGKRALAVTAMTLALLLVLIIPLTLAILAIIGRADDIVAFSRSLAAHPLPALPEWVERLPLVGGKVAERWQRLAAASRAELSERLAPHVKGVLAWLIAQLGGLIAFGVIGLFIGPVMLAVTFTLLKAWVQEGTEEAVETPVEAHSADAGNR